MAQELISDSYRDAAFVDRGSAGALFRAVRAQDGAVVAVRALDPERLGAARCEELAREHAAAAALAHPRLLACGPAVSEPDGVLLEVEWCPDGSLAGLLRRQRRAGPLPEDRVWELAAQLAEALAFLHSPLKAQGVLAHGRVSPAAVLLAGPRAKLGDCMRAPPPPGPYTAPEVARGGPPTPAADVWALGCVLAELCTLRAPCWDPAALAADPAPALERCPDALRAAAAACLCVDPARRISAAAFATFPPALWALHRVEQAAPTTESELLSSTRSSIHSPISTNHITRRLTADEPASRSSSRSSYYAKRAATVDDSESTICLEQGVVPYVTNTPLASTVSSTITQKEILNLIVQDKADLFRDNISNITTSLAATESLHFACEAKSVNCLPWLCQYLIKNGVQYSLPLRMGKNTYGESLLMTAVRNGEAQSVEQYIHDTGLIFGGRSALMMAASAGRADYVSQLLCEIGIRDPSGITALMLASSRGHVGCVQLLLIESGASDDQGSTAFDYAMRAGHTSCAILLAEFEARPNDLPWVLESCDLPPDRLSAIVKRAMTSQPIPVNRAFISIVTSLDIARRDSIWNLLRTRCSAESLIQLVSLRDAILLDDTELLRLLLDRLDQSDVILAVEEKRTHVLPLLVDWIYCKNLKIYVPSRTGCVGERTELMLAAAAGDPGLVKQHLSQLGIQCQTRLTLLASDGSTITRTNLTALMIAAYYDHTECVRLLLAELSMHDGWGSTALMYAAMHGSTEAASLLLAEAGLRNNEDKTALYHAVQSNSVGIVELLAEREGGLRMKKGWTSLMLAASRNYVECVRILAPIESQLCKDSGWTALMSASYHGHIEAVEILRTHEAHMRDSRGYSALDYAKQSFHDSNSQKSVDSCVLLLSDIDVRGSRR